MPSGNVAVSTPPIQWYANIGSCNVLVPSDNIAVPAPPMSHMASQGHTELTSANTLMTWYIYTIPFMIYSFLQINNAILYDQLFLRLNPTSWNIMKYLFVTILLLTVLIYRIWNLCCLNDPFLYQNSYVMLNLKLNAFRNVIKLWKGHIPIGHVLSLQINC